MRLRTIGLAGFAAIAAFVLVGAVVTELLSPYVEFSLFVGIPSGIVAAAATAAVVLAGLEATSPGRRRSATAVAAFGVSFVAVLLLANGLLGVPVVLSLVAATVAGLVAAAGAYFLPGERESRL